jgi:hypothetical protein
MDGPEEGIIDRPHVSPWFLWTAEHNAELARRVEQLRPDGRREPSIEHRAYVLSSLMASSAFLEAMINELFQDVADQARGGMQADYNRIITAPFGPATRSAMVAYWEQTQEGRHGTALEKYGKLLKCARMAPLPDRPRQDAKLLLDIRNGLLHFRPRDNFREGDGPRLEQELTRRKVPPNPLVGPRIRAYWPEHALGSGIARWGVEAALELANQTCSSVGIEAGYARQRQYKWAEHPPGAREGCPETQPVASN